MTGVWVALAAIVGALTFGLYRRLTDGRARSVRPGGVGLDSIDLGMPLGDAATLVQFSSAVCSPCQATRSVLARVSAETRLVAHVEIDAETRLDLVERLAIQRTPTVLVLDRIGTIRHRIAGAARLPEVVAAIRNTVEPQAA